MVINCNLWSWKNHLVLWCSVPGNQGRPFEKNIKNIPDLSQDFGCKSHKTASMTLLHNASHQLLHKRCILCNDSLELIEKINYEWVCIVSTWNEVCSSSCFCKLAALCYICSLLSFFKQFSLFLLHLQSTKLCLCLFFFEVTCVRLYVGGSFGSH